MAARGASADSPTLPQTSTVQVNVQQARVPRQVLETQTTYILVPNITSSAGGSAPDAG